LLDKVHKAYKLEMNKNKIGKGTQVSQQDAPPLTKAMNACLCQPTAHLPPAVTFNT